MLLSRARAETLPRGSVNKGLKARGLLTWFDEEKMEGIITDQMANGIRKSAVVAVFITQRCAHSRCCNLAFAPLCVTVA